MRVNCWTCSISTQLNALDSVVAPQAAMTNGMNWAENGVSGFGENFENAAVLLPTQKQGLNERQLCTAAPNFTNDEKIVVR